MTTSTDNEKLDAILANQATVLPQIANTLTIVGTIGSNVTNLIAAVAKIPTTGAVDNSAAIAALQSSLAALTTAVAALATQATDIQKQLES